MKTIKKEEQTSGGGTSWTGKRIKFTKNWSWVILVAIVTIVLTVLILN